jgi:hypothetical protein
MKTELLEFDVSIPNKDRDAILKTVKTFIECEYDEELKEWLLTEKGIKRIEFTKAIYMLLEEVITRQEFYDLVEKLDLV